jgi:hypothetical protein
LTCVGRAVEAAKLLEAEVVVLLDPFDRAGVHVAHRHDLEADALGAESRDLGRADRLESPGSWGKGRWAWFTSPK